MFESHKCSQNNLRTNTIKIFNKLLCSRKRFLIGVTILSFKILIPPNLTIQFSYPSCIFTICVDLFCGNYIFPAHWGYFYFIFVSSALWQEWASVVKALLMLDWAAWVKISQASLSEHRAHAVIRPTSSPVSFNYPKTKAREKEEKKKTAVSAICLDPWLSTGGRSPLGGLSKPFKGATGWLQSYMYKKNFF